LLPVEIYPPYKKESPLKLQVQSFSPTNGRENSHVMCVGDSELLPDQTFSTSYAVPPDALPTLENIEAWALDTMISYPRHASFGWLRSAFLQFARAYCITRNNLPLVRIPKCFDGHFRVGRGLTDNGMPLRSVQI
jgi:hypothetical protein